MASYHFKISRNIILKTSCALLCVFLVFACNREAGRSGLIVAAVKESSIKELQKLLRTGWDINERQQSGETALILAAKEGNAEIFDFLLQKGGDVFLADHHRRNALYHAVVARSVKIVLRCLDLWVDPLIEDDTGISAYQVALKSISAEIPKAFTDWERTQRELGNSPLIIAVARGNIAQVKKLLAEGHDMNSRNKNRETPLFIAVRLEKFEITKILLENGANIGGKNGLQETIWETALKNPNNKVIQVLINAKKGTIIRKQNPQNKLSSELIKRVQEDIAGVEALLKKGADIESKDSKRWTPLIYAKSMQMVELLFKNGANVNARAEHYLTPLFSAVYDANVLKVQFLLNNGADIKSKMIDGTNILMAAVTGGNQELVQFFIAKGVDINAKTHYGNTALMMAKYKGDKKIIDLLVDAGAKK